MTREEAKREMLFAKRNVMAGSWIDKAYDMAIQALSEPEEKKGRWDDLGGVIRYGCPFCHHAQERKSNFCPSCGADMRGGAADE